MADTLEAAGQDVEQEPPDELMGFEAHELLPGAMRIIAPCKANMRIADGGQPAVRDRDPVGVAAKIGQDLGRPGKRRLSILPIIMGLGSRSVTPTIRCTGKKAWSCGRKIQKGNAIFV